MATFQLSFASFFFFNLGRSLDVVLGNGLIEQKKGSFVTCTKYTSSVIQLKYTLKRKSTKAKG